MAGVMELDVTRHGAVGDGKTLNTGSLQGAIDGLHARGGGVLRFPAGRYLTGSLRLKSGVTLYLEEGAVLLGSTSPYDYPKFSTEKELKVNNDHFDQALIYADGAAIENIRVSNIHAVNTGNAIFIRLGHRSGEAPGYVRNVSIRNLYAEIPFGRPDIDYDLRGPALPFFHNPFPSSISGIPGHDIENVTLENIEIVYPGRASKGMAYISLSRLADVPENVDGYPEFSMFGELPAWGFYVRHVSGLTLKGITLHLREDDYRPAFVFDRVSRLNLSDIVLPEDKQAGQVVLRQTGLQRKAGVPERWIFSIDN